MELLEGLPARVGAVELQIVQLRGEMRDGFRELREGLRTEFRTEIRTEIGALEQRLVRRITDGDEETRRYMRVLHEEVLSRIATIREGPA